MHKIIAVFDGLKFSESTEKYAIEISKKNNSHLVGIFLDDFTYHSYKIYDLIWRQELTDEKIDEYNKLDKVKRKAAVKKFEQACEKEGLNYSVRHDRSIAILEVLHESIYADLMVVDWKETFSRYDQSIPTSFIRHLLSEVQCPVFLVPEEYNSIDNIVLLYDGEPASVYAIKMFSYLLPSLKDQPSEVISVMNPKQNLQLPDNTLMKEFMKRHFPKAQYNILKGTAKIEIEAFLKKKNPNMLVVLGAYQRGTASRWLRPSMADILMHSLKSPMFIAH